MQMEKQQQEMSDLIISARGFIVQDANALQLLGETIEMSSAPLSQSSSMMSVNGKTRTSVQASFEVAGSSGSGVATMEAVDGQIENLYLNVNGRNLVVDVTRKAGSFSSSTSTIGDDASWNSKTNNKARDGIGKNRNRGKDDVIDAEFVDKKVTK